MKTKDLTKAEEQLMQVLWKMQKAFVKAMATIALNVTDIFNTYKNKYLQQSPVLRQIWENKYETRTIKLNFTYSFGGQISKTKTSDAAADEKRRSDIREN